MKFTARISDGCEPETYVEIPVESPDRETARIFIWHLFQLAREPRPFSLTFCLEILPRDEGDRLKADAEPGQG